MALALSIKSGPPEVLAGGGQDLVAAGRGAHPVAHGYRSQTGAREDVR